MGPLPGFDAGDTGQAWYAGSLLRRGFSDPEGGRGWLLVTIKDDGVVSVERQYVNQRPQYDLAPIDASGLTGSDVEDAIRLNLGGIEVGDAIIRQRVVNCQLSVRRGVDTHALSEVTKDALVWQLEFSRPAEAAFVVGSEKDVASESLMTAGSSDLPGMFTGWFADYSVSAGVAEAVRPHIVASGTRLLRQVSETAETGVSEVAAKVESLAQDNVVVELGGSDE